MFTGLIETIGTVLEYTTLDTSSSGGNGVSLTIGNCSEILTDVHLGDSISTNGVCLTVTEFDEGKTFFKVGIAPETLRRTNLGDLKTGDGVNLERAVTSDVRLGGHVVQGHVDTIATIVGRVPDGNAITFTFKLRDVEFISYIVHKGFIAIDGTSLTITNVDYDKAEFSIMLISYSQEKVILSRKSIGDSVNIEVDLTGKLIEKQIEVNLNNQIKNNDSVLNKLIEKLVEKKVNELLSKK
ncbi:riboflavin synthase [Spathaspora passalidarum NRRL Y-27907]|uniref:Riboflavin synthase n=1 Tax=Spathaspora passalidarum (strain NRRL Y-27907 / 11-Y1) TaxID=619300 RepID=G3ASU0_SPAPN|nr:riboflavin synthase [Spathaspora passalidarum NRRL Y-27907]EGW31154.1 riboflavin synthase [Spathaspora passalidarum NRRL Y-27907]